MDFDCSLSSDRLALQQRQFERDQLLYARQQQAIANAKIECVAGSIANAAPSPKPPNPIGSIPPPSWDTWELIESEAKKESGICNFCYRALSSLVEAIDRICP